ncbi:MAG: hypothetical protein JKY84_10490 [Emcibacteraceae bacterium]|nr:hypothetical protein [Emcibacteraceae bacterium]
MTNKIFQIEISDRLDISPPFLMIDVYEEITTGERAIGTKHLKSDDWFLNCHLPKDQAMPATLQTEGMLQTLVLLIYSKEDHGDHRSFITDSKVKFKSSPEPGHDIIYEAQLLSFRRGIAKGTVVGTSNGKEICSGEFTYASPHLMVLR